MNGQSVANKDQRSSQTRVDIAHKPHDICGTRIVVEQRVVKAESFCPGSTRQGRQRRNPVVPVPCMLHRRFPHGSPHAPSQRLEQIATFVEKNQASLTLKALFLAAASPRGATERWPLRFVPWRVAWVSGDSSRVDGEARLRNPHGTRRQTRDESGLEQAELSNLK